MLNQTQNISLNARSLESYDSAIVGHILWSLWGCIGTVFNTLIIIVIYRTKRMHTSGIYNVVNLAVSDLFICFSFGIYGTRSMIYYIARRPLVETATICYTFIVIPQLFAMQVNNLVCLLIAADRLVAVTFPIWFRNRGLEPAVITCVLPWLWGVIRCLITAFYRTNVQFVTFCSTDAVIEKWLIESFIATPTVVTLTVTVILYVMLGVRIGLKAFKIRKSSEALMNYKKLIEFKMVKSLGIIVLVYAVTTQMTTLVNQQCRIKGMNMIQIISITKSFWVLNSALNFVVYVLTNSSFKRGFLKLVKSDQIMSTSDDRATSINASKKKETIVISKQEPNRILN